MEKKTQSGICNWSLLVLATLILVSGIQMETTAGADFIGIRFPVYMVIHVIVALLMAASVIWHIWLHFKWKEWVKRFSALKRKDTKILAVVAALVFVSGFAALFVLLGNGMQHHGVGGVHGKIGFAFLALGIYHIIRRILFYKKW